MVSTATVRAMRERITDEIFYALGLGKTGFWRRALGWLFRMPAGRFAGIFAAADEAVGRAGMSAGCAVVVEGLGVRVRAEGVAHLLAEGPLLVVSNHPGAYDSVAIGSCIARRDLRIIAYEVPFYRAMPNTNPRFICATADTTGRMAALRAAVNHLHDGGSMLQFASGTIEPDPAVMPGAAEELENWSPSLEIMLRKAPDTRLVLAAVSGVVLRRFAYHPLTRLRRTPLDKRRLAEFLQVIERLISPRPSPAEVRIRFDPPVTLAELRAESRGPRLLPAVIARERRLLEALTT